MYRFAIVALLSASFIVVAVCGCKQQTPDTDPTVPVKYKDGATGSGATASLEPLKFDSLEGVVKGRVVYDGTPPEMADIPKMKEHNDRAGCLAGEAFERNQQTWILGKDNAVGNVVVYLEVPKGKYIPLAKEDMERGKEVLTIEQPHCAFIPHVSAVYPSYFDGKKQTPTGQVFKAINNAPFTHNTRWVGKTGLNDPGNVTLPSGGEKVITLRPARPDKTGKDMVNFGCDIHPWMQGKALVFDNPYHAVTRAHDAKQPDGTFEIKNLPTGIPLTLVFWHEAKGEFHKLKIEPGLTKGEKDLGDIKVKS